MSAEFEKVGLHTCFPHAAIAYDRRKTCDNSCHCPINGSANVTNTAPAQHSAQALLQDFLESDAVPETSYDYVQTHGFLTALSVGPSLPPAEVWLNEIFDGEPRYADAAEREEIESALQQLLESLARTLYSGEQLALPCALNLGLKPSQAPLRGWALGFMEGVGLQEEQWFEDAEEEVGGLLLPIVVAAGLFDDPELQKLTRDPKQIQGLLKQIPDNLSELYLLFREEHHERADHADDEA